jgi:hypothetical protein
MMKHWLLGCLLILGTGSALAVEVRQFDDPDKQTRYERLIE